MAVSPLATKFPSPRSPTMPDPTYHHLRDEDGDLERDVEEGESHPLRPRTGREPPREDFSQEGRFRSLPLGRIGEWFKGPRQPQTCRISPAFAAVQSVPIDLLDRVAPSSLRKVVAFAIGFLLWLAVFVLILVSNATSISIPEYGAPVRLSCTSRAWPNDGRDCGLNGVQCLPFENASFAFRCPAECLDAKVWDPYAVGAQMVVYRPLVIGSASELHGDAYYRGDSFICGAAIHAGIISNAAGGCGILSFVGEKDRYSSTKKNGIESIGFDSSFPQSVSLKRAPETSPICTDPRWVLLGVSVLYTVVLAVCTASPAVFFFPVFSVVFFQVALASDMPDSDDYLALVQLAFSRFLPAIFTAFIVYKYCVLKALADLEAPLEKAVLWVGGCWIGGLENYTLDKLPIRRLTPRDLAQQPGAITALVALVAVAIPIIVIQVLTFRKEGRLLQYLRFYGMLVAIIVFMVLVPGLNLRIHHYILGLIFLPGTAVQTRPSLFLQGLLVGLFINGIARWGWASILETDASLAGTDGSVGGMIPDVGIPTIDGGNITFGWSTLAATWSGVSVRVNDVERFRWFKDQGPPVFSWTRTRDEPLYFRFSYFKGGFVDGFKTGDWTKPGTWERNGTWTGGSTDD